MQLVPVHRGGWATYASIVKAAANGRAGAATEEEGEEEAKPMVKTGGGDDADEPQKENEEEDGAGVFARLLAGLWIAGAAVGWRRVQERGVRSMPGASPACKVPLPTYSFEPTSFWVEPKASCYLGVSKVGGSTPGNNSINVDTSVSTSAATATSDVSKATSDVSKATSDVSTATSAATSTATAGLLHVVEWEPMEEEEEEEADPASSTEVTGAGAEVEVAAVAAGAAPGGAAHARADEKRTRGGGSGGGSGGGGGDLGEVLGLFAPEEALAGRAGVAVHASPGGPLIGWHPLPRVPGDPAAAAAALLAEVIQPALARGSGGSGGGGGGGKSLQAMTLITWLGAVQVESS
jgi:hypothetical protein